MSGPPTPDPKQCSRCKQWKPLSEFYAIASRPGRYQSSCKECTCAAAKRSHAANPERRLEIARQSYHRNRDANVERLRTYEARPEAADRYKRRRENERPRLLARVAVHNAIVAGAITPQPCWCCGHEAEAHHPDYSRPLDVVWLCKPHHQEVHAMARSMKRAEMRKAANVTA